MKTLLCALYILHSGLAFAIVQPGMIDESFNNIGPGADGGVHSLAAQPDGKILIGGDFTHYNGVPRSRVARLLADGKLDPGFDQIASGANATVHAIAVLPDSGVLIAGAFTDYSGLSYGRIARIDATGSPETSFPANGGANGTVRALTVLPSGQILVGGSFTTFNGEARHRIARVGPLGALDALFPPGDGADDTVRALAVQPDGKILIGGEFAHYDETARRGIARLNEDGTLDAGFNPGSGVNGVVNAIALLPDGKILIAGEFDAYNDIPRRCLVRLNEDGTLDLDFSFDLGTSGLGGIRALSVQPDGRILIGGNFIISDAAGLNEIFGIARLHESGSVDSSFKTAIGEGVRAFALRPDGKVILGGDFDFFDSTVTGHVTRAYLGYIHRTTSFTGITHGNAEAGPLLGRVSVKLSKTGAVSGKLATGAETLSFRGMFDETGRTITACTRKNGDTVLFHLNLTRSLALGPRLHGSVGDFHGRHAILEADPPFFSSRKNPAVSFVGNYTAALLPDPLTTQGLLPVSGAGFLRCRVGAGGTARLAGKTADGTPLSASVNLTGYGGLMLHFPLYKGQGFLNGRAIIQDNRPDESWTFYSTLSWSRPANPIYPEGFNQNVSLRGSRYLPKPRNEMPYGRITADGIHFTVAGGHISGAPEAYLGFNLAGRAEIMEGSEIGISDLKIQIQRSTGLFSGSFIHPASTRRIKFQGVLSDRSISYGFALVRGDDGRTLPATVVLDVYIP